MVGTAKRTRDLIEKYLEESDSVQGEVPREDYQINFLAHIINLFSMAVLKSMEMYLEEVRYYINLLKMTV
eukprot:snap_masked-scaffold_30-processed-gene-2.56-mRNA-1 protein AED:1.00 eAED:1.00 QI:0/-1/0/0/-1/1/1/0/69